MAEIIRLKKGLDIPLHGTASAGTPEHKEVNDFGLVPDDYPGFTWKLQVKPGEKVKIGTPLLTDKETHSLNVVSPVAGTIKEVVRGERRKILAVKITKEGEQEQAPLEIDFSTKEKTLSTLCASGMWALMRQRPYDIIPDPSIAPRDIFITAFDSAPLAPSVIVPQDYQALEEGIKVMRTLTAGKVYLGVKFGSGITSANAEVYEFQGPHPAGNVGIQIANIRPVNKGETVWALDARTVARIGKLKMDGSLDCSTVVALTGKCMVNPRLIDTTVCASIKELLKGELSKECHERVISGNVLTGKKVNSENEFLRYPYRQITAIPEGDDADEFMGWASLNPNKFSVKRSFPAFLKGLAKPFDFDSRIKGGHRAMILSGEYDKVLPMDIYPEYLIKAILAKNIDRMEQLGIYEVAPEDFALPEFVDTSKNELQQIVADGLDYLRKELK